MILFSLAPLRVSASHWLVDAAARHSLRFNSLSSQGRVQILLSLQRLPIDGMMLRVWLQAPPAGWRRIGLVRQEAGRTKRDERRAPAGRLALRRDRDRRPSASQSIRAQAGDCPNAPPDARISSA